MCIYIYIHIDINKIKVINKITHNMDICIDICIFIYIRIYIYIYVYIHIYLCVYVCMYVCMYIRFCFSKVWKTHVFCFFKNAHI